MYPLWAEESIYNSCNWQKF